jgi:hypothetical protein
MSGYMDYYKCKSFTMNDLIGKTFDKVYADDESLVMEEVSGDKYIFHHFQDCCESVEIKEIVGDLNDLQETPIVEAEEVINYGPADDGMDTQTWTFYRLGTIRGHVNISWYGTSNGYYSESVDKTIVEGGAK